MATTPDCASSQASATCAGVAPRRCGQPLQRRTARQCALVQGAVGHQRHAVGALPRQQAESRAALTQRVTDLVDGAVNATGQCTQLPQVINVEVAHAPAANAPLLHQCVQGSTGFGQGKLATPVQQAQVHALQAQPLQAALAGRQVPLWLALCG